MLYVGLENIWPNIIRARNRPVTLRESVILRESETTGF
jgi:hypothetical protein